MSIHQVSKVYSEEFVPSCPICCVFSCFFCHGHSLLLSFYLLKISLGRFFLQHLWVLSPGSWSSPSRVFLPLSLYKELFLALLFLYFISGPDLEVWPDWRDSAEFHCASIPRKGSCSTKTTKSCVKLSDEQIFAASTQYFVTKSLLTVIFVTAADQSIHNFLQFDAQSWASR